MAKKQLTLKQLENKYLAHKRVAKQRDIEFLLTFDQWLKIWEDSGHLQDRGNTGDQYVMARFGDKGPYRLGNVKIITGRQNVSEIFLNNPEALEKLRQTTDSKEFRKKISLLSKEWWDDHPEMRLEFSERFSGSGNPMFGKESAMKGKFHSKASRRKMSKKQKDKGLGKPNPIVAKANADRIWLNESREKVAIFVSNTKWITNGTTSKRISKYSRVPEGWHPGRTMNA